MSLLVAGIAGTILLVLDSPHSGVDYPVMDDATREPNEGFEPLCRSLRSLLEALLLIDPRRDL